ncbi:MAG: hypothetical protein J6E41_03720, partial [Lachnospiraceae bacterium]|nr:hypothetical protein [Lachnospiraceae bacterium]
GSEDRIFGEVQIAPDYNEVICFIETLKMKLGLKAGNTHLRCLLIEAAKGICKGAIGHKSKELRSRQSGQAADVIAYADKANTRLRSKYYKMIRHGKKKNVAVAAVARELACFIWGMMTGNITSGAGTSAPAVSQG